MVTKNKDLNLVILPELTADSSIKTDMNVIFTNIRPNVVVRIDELGLIPNNTSLKLNHFERALKLSVTELDKTGSCLLQKSGNELKILSGSGTLIPEMFNINISGNNITILMPAMLPDSGTQKTFSLGIPKTVTIILNGQTYVGKNSTVMLPVPSVLTAKAIGNGGAIRTCTIQIDAQGIIAKPNSKKEPGCAGVVVGPGKIAFPSF